MMLRRLSTVGNTSARAIEKITSRTSSEKIVPKRASHAARSKRGLPSTRGRLVLAFIPASDRQMHDVRLRRGGARQLADDAAVAKHRHPLAYAREFLDLRRSEDDAGARSRDFADERIDLRLGPYIDRRGRGVQHENPGAAGEPAPEDGLLLIAAAQRIDRRFEARR